MRVLSRKRDKLPKGRQERSRNRSPRHGHQARRHQRDRDNG